jgi:adenylate cyclase
MNAPRFQGLLLAILAAFSINPAVCKQDSIPLTLWNKAFKGDKFDTSTINSLYRISYIYWDSSRDSIQKYNQLYLEWETLYIAKGFNYGLYYIYNMLGSNCKMLYEQAKSAAYYFQALRIAEDLKDPLKVNRIRRELGLVYFLQSSWKNALYYFEPLLVYELEIGKNAKQLSVYRYLTGLCYVRMGEPDKGRPLLKDAYTWAQSSKDTQRLLEYGSGYILAQIKSGDSAGVAALQHYLLYTAKKWKKGDPYLFATLYSGMATVAMADPLKKKIARDYAILALHITQGRIGYYLPRIEAGQILYEYYKSANRFDSAVHYLELWTVEKDSVSRSENTAVISLLQAAHDFDKREAALRTEEKQKRQGMWVLAAVLFLIGLIIFFFYRSLARQKQRTENLLENILPRETITELKTFGHAIPRIHDEVTILFCDVRSFTRIAETLSPASLVSMLDYYFRGFDEIVADLGLEKIKTIGDAYMVAGGLHPGAGNAETVVEAANRMLLFTHTSRPDMVGKYGSSFEFRVGIHTGSVISGVVGRDKYAYDIWGDAVNVAARMEQNSEEGKINVSGETWKRVQGKYDGFYRGKVEAKNKGEIDMYFVQRSLST